MLDVSRKVVPDKGSLNRERPVTKALKFPSCTRVFIRTGTGIWWTFLLSGTGIWWTFLFSGTGMWWTFLFSGTGTGMWWTFLFLWNWNGNMMNLSFLWNRNVMNLCFWNRNMMNLSFLWNRNMMNLYFFFGTGIWWTFLFFGTGMWWTFPHLFQACFVHFTCTGPAVGHCRCRNLGPLCWGPRADKCSCFKARRRSEYSHVCFTYCREFLLKFWPSWSILLPPPPPPPPSSP